MLKDQVAKVPALQQQQTCILPDCFTAGQMTILNSESIRHLFIMAGSHFGDSLIHAYILHSTKSLPLCPRKALGGQRLVRTRSGRGSWEGEAETCHHKDSLQPPPAPHPATPTRFPQGGAADVFLECSNPISALP